MQESAARAAHPTAEDLLAALGLPAETRVGLRVPKKDLAEHAPTSADRRLLQDAVESCTWSATLKPTTCALAAVVDAEREYSEIAVLVLHRRPGFPPARLRRLLHRAIPYPLVLIDAAAGSPAALTLAHRRRTSAGLSLDGDPLTTEGLPWPPPALAACALAALAPATLEEAYDGWLGHIEALQAAAITGTWAPARTPDDRARRRAALARHADLAARAATHARALKKTSHLAQVVEANLALQATRQQQRALFPDLSLDAP